MREINASNFNLLSLDKGFVFPGVREPSNVVGPSPSYRAKDADEGWKDIHESRRDDCNILGWCVRRKRQTPGIERLQGAPFRKRVQAAKIWIL